MANELTISESVEIVNACVHNFTWMHFCNKSVATAADLETAKGGDMK